MSSIIYTFKRLQCLHLHFIDFNIFSHLRFQKTTMSSFSFTRLQCHLSFIFLQDFNIFCLLHLIRLQHLLPFIGLNVLVFVLLRTQHPLFLCLFLKKKLQMSSALHDFNVLHLTFSKTSISSCFFGFTSLVFTSCLVEYQGRSKKLVSLSLLPFCFQ